MACLSAVTGTGTDRRPVLRDGAGDAALAGAGRWARAPAGNPSGHSRPRGPGLAQPSGPDWVLIAILAGAFLAVVLGGLFG